MSSGSAINTVVEQFAECLLECHALLEVVEGVFVGIGCVSTLLDSAKIQGKEP